MWFTLFAIITATFTIASVAGLDKGIKWLANGTSKIFYVLLVFLLITGTNSVHNGVLNTGIGYWSDHFHVTRGLDPAS